jgi:hypothetical protein
MLDNGIIDAPPRPAPSCGEGSNIGRMLEDPDDVLQLGDHRFCDLELLLSSR